MKGYEKKKKRSTTKDESTQRPPHAHKHTHSTYVNIKSKVEKKKHRNTYNKNKEDPQKELSFPKKKKRLLCAKKKKKCVEKKKKEDSTFKGRQRKQPCFEFVLKECLTASIQTQLLYKLCTYMTQIDGAPGKRCPPEKKRVCACFV